MRKRLMDAGVAAVFSLLATSALASAAPPLRFIDAHSHLMLPDVPADKEIALFREAGIAAVLIMHADPVVLQSVASRHPGYVVPFSSVARLPTSMGLRLDTQTAMKMGTLLDSGAVCGLGEIPTRIQPRAEATDAAALLSANRRQIYALAASRRAPVNFHVDFADAELVAAFGRIAADYPRMAMILAHAGWSAGAEVIGPLLAAHPNISVDLSMRMDPLNGWGSPALPGPPGPNPLSILNVQGALRHEWRSLLEQFPDRFMFAMDITGSGANGRHLRIAELLEVARQALAPLPHNMQAAIAHGNIERVLRTCAAGPARQGKR